MPFALRTLIVSVVLLLTNTAWAERRRLGFIRAPERLAHAVSIALSPWEIDTVSLETAPDSRYLATRDARAIAVAKEVDAIAWLVENEGDRAIWLYDVRDDQTVTRTVIPGEIDDASAASIALSLKTLLRASTVAPPQERLGGRAESRIRGPGVFRLELDGGSRLNASTGTFFESRVGFAVSFWPRFLEDRLGLAVRYEDGPGWCLDAVPSYLGRFADHTVSAALRGRIPLGSILALEPGIGGALHITTITGGWWNGLPPVDISRNYPAAELSLGLSATIARWALLGARATGAYWGDYHRYGEGGAILTLPPFQGNIALFVGGAIN
ncbi:hypothetical protein LZC95_21040 [Pendulispora brunnea]|uniref:Uncharacterized protein n=1 Tax=Pendulispora brunnea TaxID=2905690 RepID=A0ABZ2KP03_9BACT